MSYILDALKRADAERGQGATPPLAGTAPLVEAAPARQLPGKRLWPIAIAAFALIAASVWAWQTFRSATEPTEKTVAVTAAPLATNPPSPAEPPTTPTATAESTAPAAPRPPISPQPPAPVRPILAKAPPPPPAKPRPAPAATAAAAPAAAPSAAPPPLSAAQKAALPQITVSGSSYSANPAHRMLIANGQVVKEGQELSPGLTLESIGTRSAIFNQRGTRFNVNY